MMKNKIAVAIATLVMAMGATAQAGSGTCGQRSSSGKDIVDTAVAAGNFKTLVAAVKAADLTSTLKSSGPFTVFAPTDEAFAKLPDGTIKTLLANPDRLAAILKYHVVPGRVKAADVVKLTSAKTVLGQSLAIKTCGGVKIGNAKVVKTDIETSNGVIHVIDSVLLPANDIVETARTAGSFTTLITALEAAGLTDALRAKGPLTVFAPTDAAFAKLPKGTVEALLNDIPKLQSILTYHVVSGRVMASDVVKLKEAKTLQGKAVRIDTSSGVKINTASVVKTDIAANNGIVHVIDEVLLPPMNTARTSAAGELIGRAIERGVPLYNDGNHAACTAVYEIAAMGLLASDEEMIGTAERSTIEEALTTVRNSHDATRNAWVMRHALDEVYASTMSRMN